LTTDLAAKAASSHTHAESDVTSLVADLAAKQATSAKGAASGYASLGSDTKVPAAQLPSDKCRVWSSMTTSTNSSTWYLATHDNENYDTNSLHSTSVNTGRITIATTGYYRITASMAWAGNAAGLRSVQIRLNDSSTDGSTGTGLAITTVGCNNGGAVATVQCVTSESLTAGDYVTMYGWQNGGNGIALSGGRSTIWFSVEQVS
jgi:hypothetical protein